MNKNSKVKGKRYYNKGNHKGSKDKYAKDCSVVSDAINDASYYIHSNGEVLNEQLNTYSFDQFMGVPVELGTVASVNQVYELGNIMQIQLNPSVSFTDPTNPTADGVNVEALRTYTRLSAQNGKTTQYGPQDVTILLLAVGSVLANFSHAARALGLAGTYNWRNRSYPRQAVKAAGFDIDDIKSNWANYRTMYNYLVHRFNQIPIPASLNYFKKMSKLYSGLYLDELGSQMSQTFVLMPRYCWVFDEAYNSNGSGLRTTQCISNNDTTTGFGYMASFTNFLGIIETQINALLSSATLNYVYSDILRLHNKDNLTLFVLEDVPFNYAVVPSKVEELSYYLNNATILPDGTASTGTTVSGIYYTAYNDVESDANDNCIIYRPILQFLRNMTGFKPIMNFKTDNPTTEEKVWATRFSHQVKTSFDNTLGWYATDATLTDVYIAKIVVASGSGNKGQMTESTILGTTAISGLTVNWMKFVGMMSQFDWHPYVYVVDDTSPNIASPVAIVGDTQFTTTISYETLNRIDDVAMMALLEVR